MKMKTAAWMVAMSLAPMALAQAAGGVEAAGMYYWKEWKPVTLDPDRVAVQAATLESAVAAAKGAGIDGAAVKEHTLKGWYVVVVPAGADIRGVVAALAAEPTVEFATPVFVGPYGPNWVTRDVIVGFGEGVGGVERDQLWAQAQVTAGAGKLRDRDWMPGVDRAVSGSKNGFEVMAQANALAVLPQVTFAEPDQVWTNKSELIPNDPFFNQLWGVHNTGQSGGVADNDLNGPEAWDVTTGSAGVTVVVMDMGVELNHPDLNMSPLNADFTGNGTGGWPLNGCDNHGTAVAGCVTGRINNAIGVAGIAPNCRVASAKIGVSQVPCNGFWNGNLSWSADAINWAFNNGFRVTNNSNSFGGTSAAVETAYASTRSAANGSVVHFVSAGNSGAGSLSYPSSLSTVNAVASLDRDGVRSGFSQFGNGLDFIAPGSEIITTDNQGAAGYAGGDYVQVQGTSFASPYTAGVAALVLSRNGSLTAPQVESLMASTAKDRGAAGYDTGYGWGIPNARAAVDAAAPAPGNNGCSGAQDITTATLGSGGSMVAGTLVNATNDGAGDCGNSAGNPDVWYSFTAPSGGCGGVLRVTTCGTHDTGGTDAGVDTVLSLHSACGQASLVCNDDASGACPGLDSGLIRDSMVTRTLAAGETVRIRVSKYGATPVGPFTLRATFGPANDNCANATPIGDGAQAFCTTNATTDGLAEPAACTFFSNAQVTGDVWFRYTAPCTGSSTVTTCGSSFDTKINVYPGTCPSAAGTVLACSDDNCGLQTTVTFSTTQGTQYLVRVGGYNNLTGSVTMNVTSDCPPVCGDSDFNGDGDFGTDADIEAFFACLGGNCCASCWPGGADFNGDGDVGTDADIEAFFRVLGGAPC